MLIINLIMLFTLVGCTPDNIKKASDVIAPKSKNLAIEGIWRIDESSSSESNNYVGTNIEIDLEYIEIFGIEYKFPQYRLKLVNREEIQNGKDYFEDEVVKVYSIIQGNNIICEFVPYSNDEAVIYYLDTVFKVKKTSEVIEARKNEYDIAEYDKEVGVMVALKTPRDIQKGIIQDEYRTIWISYQNGTLNPIIEKPNIILPRMNGMWEIKTLYKENNNKFIEYFVANPIGLETSEELIIEEKSNVYKTINFVSNDYIGIEKYQGDKFDSKYNELQMVPIDNINTNNSIYINDIYDKEGINRYNDEYKSMLKNIPNEEVKYYNEIPNYQNFSLRRKEGTWNIVGRISATNNNQDNYDFNFSTKPNKKILNYDMLSIPWKVLKDSKPYIQDAFMAPNSKLALILEEDDLSIYEIKDNLLADKPIAVIDLADNEQIIMAEWCTVGYVDKWQKVFNNGTIIQE